MDHVAIKAEGSGLEEKSACLNCGAELNGSFCQECGQSSSVERYTVKSLTREVYNKFRSLDATAAFHTFRALTLDGGNFVREYLNGKRVGYTNPVVYFFYFFVVEALLIRGLRFVTDNPEFARQGVTGVDLQLVALLSTVFWGFLWWVFFRRSELNLVENSVAAVYYVAQVNIASLIFLIASAFLAKRYPMIQSLSSIAEVFLYLGYGIFFARRLFNEPFWKLIPKHLLLTLLYGIIFVLFTILDAFSTAFFNQVAK